MNGHQHYEPEDRIEALRRYQDYIRGGRDKGSAVESMDIDALEAELTTRIKTAKPSDQHKLHFDLAVLRNIRYATASSIRCKTLGAVNGLRELYEGARILARR